MKPGEHEQSPTVHARIEASRDSIRHLLTLMAANTTIDRLDSLKIEGAWWWHDHHADRHASNTQTMLEEVLYDTRARDAPFGITTHSRIVTYDRDESIYNTAMEIDGRTAADFERVFGGSKYIYETESHQPFTRLHNTDEDPRKTVPGRVNSSPSSGVVEVEAYDEEGREGTYKPVVEVRLNRREFREFIVVMASYYSDENRPYLCLKMERTERTTVIHNGAFEIDGRSFDLVAALTFGDGSVSCIEIPSMRETRYNGSSVPEVHAASMSVEQLSHAPVLVFKLRPFGLSVAHPSVEQQLRWELRTVKALADSTKAIAARWSTENEQLRALLAMQQVELDRLRAPLDEEAPPVTRGGRNAHSPQIRRQKSTSRRSKSPGCKSTFIK